MSSASESRENAAFDRQVDPDHYSPSRYLTPKRMASLGWQLQLTHQWFPGASVLEIGSGPGLMRNLLALDGHAVTTIDPDSALEPDVVGSLPSLPFADGSFDCVLCCQVLEHLPWDTAPAALRELWRVCRQGAVVSVPSVGPAIGILAFDARHDGVRTLSLPSLARRHQRNEREHHWELEANVRTSAFRSAILSAGFDIHYSSRPAACLYHHFFVLKKNCITSQGTVLLPDKFEPKEC